MFKNQSRDLHNLGVVLYFWWSPKSVFFRSCRFWAYKPFFFFRIFKNSSNLIPECIGTGPEQEKVRLVRGSPIQVDTGIGGLTEFTITESGLYILVHTRIGVTLIWDRATRIEVKVTGQHFNSVSRKYSTWRNQSKEYMQSLEVHAVKRKHGLHFPWCWPWWP